MKLEKFLIKIWNVPGGLGHKKSQPQEFIRNTLEEPQDFWQLYDCKAGIVCRPRILAKTPKKYSIKPIKQNINIDPKLKAASLFL
jgi:hypothetical protein